MAFSSLANTNAIQFCYGQIGNEFSVTSSAQRVLLRIDPQSNWGITHFMFACSATVDSPTARVVIYACDSNGFIDTSTVLATGTTTTVNGYYVTSYPVSYTATAGTPFWASLEFVSGTSAWFQTQTGIHSAYDFPWAREFYTRDSCATVHEAKGCCFAMRTAGHGNFVCPNVVRVSSAGISMYNDAGASRECLSGYKFVPQKTIRLENVAVPMRKTGSPTGWTTTVGVYNSSKTLLAKSYNGYYDVSELHTTNYYNNTHTMKDVVTLDAGTTYYILLRLSLATCGDASNYLVPAIGIPWGGYAVDANAQLYVYKSYCYSYSGIGGLAEYTTGNMNFFEFGGYIDPPSGGGLLVNPGLNGGLIQI